MQTGSHKRKRKSCAVYYGKGTPKQTCVSHYVLGQSIWPSLIIFMLTCPAWTHHEPQWSSYFTPTNPLLLKLGEDGEAGSICCFDSVINPFISLKWNKLWVSQTSTLCLTQKKTLNVEIINNKFWISPLNWSKLDSIVRIYFLFCAVAADVVTVKCCNECFTHNCAVDKTAYNQTSETDTCLHSVALWLLSKSTSKNILSTVLKLVSLKKWQHNHHTTDHTWAQAL